ncbi:hypothetical protein HYT57_03085 [Candidatus Woesearchaeota archaeon]|nr:hypothetical protein [Candidatus Woesearchaeota archaeon]
MGKEKYIKEVEALFEKSPVVSYASIERIIKNKKNVKQYVKRLIHYLLKKNRIKRLTKGFYTKIEDNSLAVFCFKPAYLGLQDALSYHNLWEQETIPVIITARKIRPGVRKILGKNVLIRRIEKKYLFGIEYDKQNNVAIPYSDIEKTFIDMIYFKEKIDNVTLNNLKRNINKRMLDSYLKMYKPKIRKTILDCFNKKDGYK